MDPALVPAATASLEPFAARDYLIVRPVFSLRRIWRVFDPDGQLVVYVEHPLLRLRDEWILYADAKGLSPLLVVKQRRLAGFNVEHDVFDAVSGAHLGTLRTRALRSILRDQWDILGPDQAPAGEMVEEGKAWLRRFLRFLPGTHRISLGGRVVARLRQTFHFFRREFALSIAQIDDPIEPRFAIACALIAAQAELRREGR